jgi:hypothetical protein
MGSVVKWALLLGGAYWIYEAWQGSQGAYPGLLTPGTPAILPPANTTTTVTVTPPAPPVVSAPTLSAIRSQLQALADGDLAANPTQGGLDADQWVYYYQQIRGVTVPGSTVAAILQNLGLPVSGSARQTIISLDQFISAASSAGLAGYGGRGFGAVPIITLRNRGRVFTLPLPLPAIAAVGRARAQRRGANYVRRATPMVGGMR